MTESGIGIDKSTAAKGIIRMEANDKEYGPEAEGFPPRIPAGEYQAICHTAEIGTGWGYRRTLYLRFRIYGGDYDGTDLFMPCPYPDKLRYRHKLYKQWMLAIGGPPTQGQRFSRKVFLNRMFRVLVQDTERRHEGGKVLPDFAQYSVVKTILEPLTGGQPREL